MKLLHEEDSVNDPFLLLHTVQVGHNQVCVYSMQRALA